MTTTPTVPTVTAVPDSNDPAAHTAAFFDALYLGAPDDHPVHSLLWTMPDKRSTWFDLSQGSDPIARQARTLADAGRDVYVSVSASNRAGTVSTRIKSEDACGIFGMWADIDIADPDVHKKWNLPPTLDAAHELLDAAGAEPTLIVHSGHGLQAWWLFHEFWQFDNESDRLEAAGAAQRWNTTLQVHAAERSWVVDATFDLARVLRVPGTLNRKGQPVVPVRLLKADGPRYGTDELDDFVRDGTSLRGIAPTRTYKADTLDLSDANKVDFERLQALIDNTDTFQATWDMKRKDFPDQSPSSYDMSLATQAAAAGWSDQEIADLIRAFRRRHKLDTSKADRLDYIERTLGRARAANAKAQVIEQLEDASEDLREAKASGDDEAIRPARRSVFDGLSQQLEVEVIHFIKYLSEPPAFALVTPTVTIPLGGADGFLQYVKFKQAVAAYCNVVIPRFKSSDWDDICQRLLDTVEEQDIGAEATERGEVAAWLSTYLGQRPPVDTLEEAATSTYPYVEEDGRVCLFGPALRTWLYLTYQEKVTNKELGRRLRAFGCEPLKVNVNEGGKRTSRSVWRLPAGTGE